MFEELWLPNGGKKLHPSNSCSSLQLGQSLAFKVYCCSIPHPCHRADSSKRFPGIMAKILRAFQGFGRHVKSETTRFYLAKFYVREANVFFALVLLMEPFLQYKNTASFFRVNDQWKFVISQFEMELEGINCASH